MSPETHQKEKSCTVDNVTFLLGKMKQNSLSRRFFFVLITFFSGKKYYVWDQYKELVEFLTEYGPLSGIMHYLIMDYILARRK